eukprot:CAMPEP_0195507400 /NCGR_PEP_ID=MMETSP0794_2-20130614/862_1 /TAXON_ID=515487 /ORGANISM="Stephanopyxis turris, Strain CCMP 815" /LENGTH=208 /DNA_ID=CAMNT_0040634073 /DNA_START=43 /DNA_END=669 /DNA_ORIENTATION=+
MALKLFILACLASVVSAEKYLRVQDHPDFARNIDELGLDAAGCSCSAKECSCCLEVKNTHIIKFDVNFCANLALVNNDQDVELSITVDGDSLFSKDFDISELSKLSEECVTVFKGVQGCLELTNFTNNATYIGACAGLELKIASRPIASYEIGCWGLTVSNKDACDQGLLDVCGADKGQACEDCYTQNKDELDLDGCDADIVKELCGA